MTMTGQDTILDQRIAVEVMGGRITFPPTASRGFVLEWDGGLFQTGSAHELRPYSSSWDAAGLVVEKMRGMGFPFMLAHSPNDPGVWNAAFDHNADSASTAPKAICWAALRALGRVNE